jgi:hypothetical protein
VDTSESVVSGTWLTSGAYSTSNRCSTNTLAMLKLSDVTLSIGFILSAATRLYRTGCSRGQGTADLSKRCSEGHSWDLWPPALQKGAS